MSLNLANIQTDIVINAPPQIVFQTLTDLDSYSKWNPFIISSKRQNQGSQIINVGEKLTNTHRMNGKDHVFTPIVTNCDYQEYQFSWLGTLGCKGIFAGEHRFQCLQIEDNKTNLLQSEYFSGCLICMCCCCLGGLFLNDTKAEFMKMNESLKVEAEKRFKNNQGLN